MTGKVRLPRLLPVTIWVTGALLLVKGVGFGFTVWSGNLMPGGATIRTSMVAAAMATEHPPAHAATPVTAVAAPPSLPASSSDSARPPPEPQVSPAERQLLLDLRSRRLELERRDQALTDRAGILEAAEQRLTGRIAELSALQTRLERMEADRLAHDDANWAGIVKLYETMKPRDAAVIFNDMDMTVLLPVVDRMREAKASAILAAMQPDRARLLTGQLAVQRTRAITVPDHPRPG